MYFRAIGTLRARPFNRAGQVLVTAGDDFMIQCRFPAKGEVMLYWSAMFLVIALVALLLGFSSIAASAAGMAKILFVVFLVLFILSLFAGGFRRGPAP